MSVAIPSVEPSILTAGDTAQWTRAVSSYSPGDGWTLTYALVSSDCQIEITSTDNGDGSHLVSVAASVTTNYAPGCYRWQAYVTKGSERFTVDYGDIEIRPDFAVSDRGYDDRTPTRRYLDALLAARAEMVETGGRVAVGSYGISGRSTQYRTLQEIDEAIRRARAEVVKEERRERIARGLGHSGRVLVRFR